MSDAAPKVLTVSGPLNIGKPYLAMFFQEKPRLILSNGEDDQVVIPNDLLPESQRNGSTTLDAVVCVQHLVQRCRELEAENAELRQRVADYSTELVILLSQKQDMEKRINSLEHDLMFLEARHSQNNLKTKSPTPLPAYGWRKLP